MPIDKWERAHRANIKKGVADINRQLSLNANSIAHKIKILQSKQALSASKYGSQILRNQTLLKSISKEFYNLEGNVNKSLAGLTKSSWDLANKKNDADLLKYESLKGLFKKSWTQPNTAAYNAFMKRNVGGLNLSERIHNYTEQNKQLYLDYIGSGITQGKSAAEIARELHKINNDPENVTVFDKKGNPKKMGLTSKLLVEGAQGQGIYKSPLKNLMRVTRNETNVAYRTADFERRQDLDFVVGIEVHLSNSHHTDDMCDPLQGKYPKDFKFYNWHVMCMCYTTSILATLEEMNAYFKTGEMKSANEVKEMPKNANKWVKETGIKAKKFDFVKNDSRLSELVNPKLTKLTDQAKANSPDFTAKSNALAKRTGVSVTDTNLKSDLSIIRKVKDEYKGDYSMVKDSIRNTFIAPTGKHEMLISEVKKTFDVTGVKRQISDMGYTGNLLNVRFKDGLIGEVQVNTKQMIYAKDTDAKFLLPKSEMDSIFKQTGLPPGLGHTYYEEHRILKASEMLTSEILKRMEELEKLSVNYYETIRKAK